MTKNKDLSLEGLRGLACAVVATGHFCFIYFPYLAVLYRPYPGVPCAYLFERIFQYPPFSLAFSADAAVSVFFVLSGYVLTTKYFVSRQRIELEVGAAKRYVRLALPTLAAILLAWVLWKTGAIQTQTSVSFGAAGWVPMYYAGHPPSFAGTLFNGLIGAPLLGNTVMDGPLWSIQVELIGSVLLFAQLAILGRHPIWLLLWFAFFADILSSGGVNALYYLSFLAGAYLNVARDWLRQNPKLCYGLLIAALVGLSFDHSPLFKGMQAIPLPNFQPHGPNFNLGKQLVWNTLGAIAMIAAALGLPRVGRFFAARVPVFLGKISLSIYIVHWPLLMSIGLGSVRVGLKLGLPYIVSVMIAFVVFWATVLLVAIIFQRYIDKPSIRLAELASRPGVWYRTARFRTENTLLSGD